ncbi:MAG: transporter, family, putative efflux transporter [Methanolobus sp.]|nr:transporter, family, putative efflux transporter [Methanolobus sp.]MDK2939184.1 transporter, family, putative efflux transporter [Methanolobus sp.]
MNNTWKIYMLALICFLISTSEFVIIGILDRIAESAHVSLSAAGQLITVFAIASAIGTPIVVMAMGKMDWRKVLMISLSLVALGSFMVIVSSNFALLLVSRIILAIGTGVFVVTSLAVAAKLATPERQAGAIATLTTGFSAALIIGLPIGRVVTAAYDWTAIFWGTGIFSLLAILMVALTIPVMKGDDAVPLSKQIALLKNSKIMIALAITFFWIAGYAVLYSYITPFLMDVAPMSERILSIALFAFGLATLVGTKLGGFLADRLGISRSLVGSLGVHVIALTLLSIVAGSTLFTIPLLMLWAVSAWTTGPIQQFNILSLAPESSGIMLSLNNSILQFGFAAGAGIGGVAVGNLSMLSLSWTGAALVTIAVLIAAVPYMNRSFSKGLVVK